ncbi:MAG: hypothetical protein HEQ16_05110 [Bosea sp.]|jgi:hypothetical protein|nr:hypothetical protein [Bosea sp. (in: a-proteobacteria)]
MTRLRISDHALVRFLERAGGLDIDAVRAAMAEGLGRAAGMAEEMRAGRYTIVVDGLRYVVERGTLVTVLDGDMTAIRLREPASGDRA